eukprot:TRINITY_DN1108_c2_g1_i1.p1 TRINITY_DN1108_c2_g1~~TRINITY_DN1108_c2_g1_i1.p1  ORF type:complete len:446 (+),score=133.07 TRINITY_DN1108_c2_g1_i1:98-1435(+)
MLQPTKNYESREASPVDTIEIEQRIEQEKRERGFKRSIWVSMFAIMVYGTSLSILLPTLWPYIDKLGLNHTDLGKAQIVNSVGLIFGCLFLGFIAIRVSYKAAFLISSVFGFIGYFFYAIILSLGLSPLNSLYLMYISRLFAGLATSYSLVMAYISAVVPEQTRTGRIAITQAILSFSYVLGPAIEAILTLINFSIGPIIFNDCTLAGYLCAILYLILIIFVFFFFSTLVPPCEDIKHNVYSKVPPKKILLMVCFGITYFCLFCGLAAIDLIGTPITEKYYLFNTLSNSILWGSLGIISLIGPISIRLLTNRISDTILLLGWFCLTTISFASLLDFTKPLPLWVYITCNGVISASFPACMSLINAIFSKILADRPKATVMGILQMTAGAGRLITSLWAGQIFSLPSGFGPTIIYAISGILQVISAILILIFQQWTFVATNRQFKF